jgi:pimeloyl-ACP methyl ester carboxylesterase
VSTEPSRLAIGDTHVVELLVAGPESGIPVLVHHGTPGARLDFPFFIDTVLERGLRYVSYSRPGYGGSTRQAGRSVADCAEQAAAVLDHLGAERFYSFGWSGGGPHALACAAELGDRVIAAATLAGVAPYGADGLDWMNGMGPENIAEFGAALAGPDTLKSSLAEQLPALRNVTGAQIVEALGGLVSEVDQQALTGELGDVLATNFREGLREGLWGWLDDDLAFTRDWGFQLTSISAPVDVWQGAQDRMVPFAHGRWLTQHIPTARARLEPEEGHISLALRYFERIIDTLVATR